MEPAKLQAVHPVFPSQDVRVSIGFYTRLGFALAFQDSPSEPRYAGLRRDDVDALFEDLADKGVFQVRTALRATAWGTREFAFHDPHRNGLTFYCDLEQG